MHSPVFTKWLWLETAERLARLSLGVRAYGQQVGSSPSVEAWFRKAIQPLQAGLQQALQNHFQSAETDPQKTGFQQTQVKSLQHQMDALFSALSNIWQPRLSEESTLFLNEVLPTTKALAQMERVLAISTAPHLDTPLLQASNLLYEQILFRDHAAPLQWVQLAQQALLRIAGQKQASLALGVSLFGPAYVYASLAEAMPFALETPYLETGLQPGVKQLREAGVEDSWFTQIADSFITANPDDVPVTAYGVPYSQKHHQQAIQLQSRLAQGLLLSACEVGDADHLWAQLALLDDAEAVDPNAIYGLLAQSMETPVPATVVLNAGWLYKLNQMDTWLTLLASDVSPEQAQGNWQTFEGWLFQLDGLLSKSIETAAVHRVLVADPLLAKPLDDPSSTLALQQMIA